MNKPFKVGLMVGGGLLVLGVIGNAIGGNGQAARGPAPAAAAATSPPIVLTVPPPTPTVAPKRRIGDAIQAANWTVTVAAAERVAGPLTWNSLGTAETPIGEWLVVTVRLENTGHENHTLNPWDFELHTASGTIIKHTTEFIEPSYAELHGQIGLGRQIPPGATVTTPLLFDIPAGMQGLDLVFLQAREQPVNVG